MYFFKYDLWYIHMIFMIFYIKSILEIYDI